MLQALALPGIHDAVHSLLGKTRPPARLASDRAPRVLDLGAGTGAFATTLARVGYDVFAADLLPERCAVDCRKVDLNSDFAAAFTDAAPFDVVTCIEVIEHVENPRHLLRQIKALLKPDGVAILTTPNIECVPGRLRFLLTGELRQFGRDERWNEVAHISPIHTLMFERALTDTGLRLVEHTFDKPAAQAGKLVTKLLSAAVSPVTRGVRGGDAHLFVVTGS